MGIGAYARNYAGSPEVRVLNRFAEISPTNLKEGVSLLARPGTNMLVTAAADTQTGTIRKLYSKAGLMNGDLFIVSGSNLWRYTSIGHVLIHISGVIGLASSPKFTWDSGEGYEYLFVSDGELLQYYPGGTHASGTLSGTYNAAQLIIIDGVYYGFNASVDYNSPNGSAAHPWLCNPGSDPLTALANMIDFVGTPGTDFSSALGSANTVASALAYGGPPATSITFSAYSDQTFGNTITTAVSGSGLAFGASTLTGGGVHALHGVYIPTGEPANALCTLDHFIMVSVGNTNKMYFIEPGATTIDALNFFSKESNPDPIVDLLTYGDTFIAAGAGSIETWYATGDLTAPFAPIEGQTITRGVVAGTLTLVQDTPVFVGADGIVYAYGQQSTRISNHGIEERLRTLFRSQAGLT
jgi:hypothetical protein